MSEKATTILIIVLSIAVPGLVAALFYVKPPELATGMDLAVFPKFHAILNSLTAACLVTGVILSGANRSNSTGPAC